MLFFFLKDYIVYLLSFTLLTPLFNIRFIAFSVSFITTWAFDFDAMITLVVLSIMLSQYFPKGKGRVERSDKNDARYCALQR